MTEYKKCNKCGVIKPKTINFYYQNKKIKSGFEGICKVCILERTRKYRESNREKINKRRREHHKLHKEDINKKKRENYNPIKNREQKLKYKYNLSLDEYDEMFKKQNGKCEICGDVTERPLDVDHNHKTGKIRGLLCNACNRGIENFKENPLKLIKTVYYLEKYK